MMKIFFSHRQGVFHCSLFWGWIPFLASIQAAVLRIVCSLSLKKRGFLLPCIFILFFFLITVSQGGYEAAEKEQRLGEKSVEVTEHQLLIYSLRCWWSYWGAGMQGFPMAWGGLI